MRSYALDLAQTTEDPTDVRDAVYERFGNSGSLWYSTLRKEVMQAIARRPKGPSLPAAPQADAVAPAEEQEVPVLDIPALSDDAKKVVNQLLARCQGLEADVAAKEEVVRSMTATLKQRDDTIKLLRKVSAELLEGV